MKQKKNWTKLWPSCPSVGPIYQYAPIWFTRKLGYDCSISDKLLSLNLGNCAWPTCSTGLTVARPAARLQYTACSYPPMRFLWSHFGLTGIKPSITESKHVSGVLSILTQSTSPDLSEWFWVANGSPPLSYPVSSLHFPLIGWWTDRLSTKLSRPSWANQNNSIQSRPKSRPWTIC